jgi:hypothetical protein
LLSAIAQFSLSNISYDEAKVELGVVLPNPQIDYLFGSVKVTRFRVDGVDVDELERRNNDLQNQLRSGVDDCKFSAGERTLRKKESVRIHAEYQMVKEEEDNEFLRSLYPTESLTIRVYYNSDEISAPRARSIHAQKLTQIAADNSPNLRIWRIDRPLLPQQGVVFWWKRR